jgi:hypothetical protein
VRVSFVTSGGLSGAAHRVHGRWLLFFFSGSTNLMSAIVHFWEASVRRVSSLTWWTFTGSLRVLTRRVSSPHSQLMGNRNPLVEAFSLRRRERQPTSVNRRPDEVYIKNKSSEGIVSKVLLPGQ